MKTKIEEIAERLIDKEILANQTSLVCELQNQANIDFSFENVSNLFDYGESDEGEPKDIYQWFLVTDWLAEKLDRIDEPVLSNDFGKWWGRTCYGQAIISDGTFQAIARNLEG